MAGWFSFSATWKGLRKVRNVLSAVLSGIRYSLGKGHIEDFLLQRTKDRFTPLGATEVSQRSPDGKLWQPIAPSTVRRRKRNRNRLQALVDTGTLEGSITILGTNLDSPSATQSFKGGLAKIGVSRSSPAFSYFRLHQNGGVNRHGARVPARKFLGVGARAAVQIGRNMLSDIRSKVAGVI